MKILVLNSGSSSLKFQLIQLPEQIVLAKGAIEEIGKDKSIVNFTSEEKDDVKELIAIPDFEVGLNKVAHWLMLGTVKLIEKPSDLFAIGHRVVHGGEVLKKSMLATPEVKTEIKKLFGLAPLHNPANLKGIEVAEQIFKGVKQYAVFDTSFYADLPANAYRYPVPKEWYTDYGVRVYGFHGTSHKYVAAKGVSFLGLEEKHKIISIHLGNGCSMAAIKNGTCIDTTMGLGPLPGLMMGTRSGDLDPSVLFYLHEKGFTVSDLKESVNKKSGLLGIAGDNDLRTVLQKRKDGDKDAALALAIYTYRIKKYIGAYIAALGGIDALIFTAGGGENSNEVRWESCEGLDCFNINLDAELNNKRLANTRNIAKESSVPVLIVPTNEELAIALEVNTL